MNEKPWLDVYPQNIRQQIDVPHHSLPQMLLEKVETYAQHVALSFQGQELTYEDLGAVTSSFASALQGENVQRGDRVAIMLPNCPQYVIACYGTLMVGGTVTQINPMLTERELTYILNDSGAETIVILNDLYQKMKAVQNETMVKNVVVVNLTANSTSVEPAVTFDEFLEKGGEQEVSQVALNPEEDIAVLQYTGGTTGRSKGVMLTHRNLMANLVQIYEFFKEDLSFGCERILTVIPLFHVYGMSNGMNLAIFLGATNIMLPRFDVQNVLETIKEEKPTMFPGVPTMYISLLTHPEAEKYGLDSIRVCISGSAPMPVERMKEFEQKTGAKILDGYGLSETAPSTHANPLFAERKPGSVGIGLPSTDYKIVDTHTGQKVLPPGETGEIIIRGPQVMKGYWKKKEETQQALRDGWLYTGDMAYMDDEGYLYIADRKKDMIIASGYNVYPREVEEVLNEHAAVLEAAVVGVADDYRGETVKAFIVLREGASITEEEVIAHSRKYLAAYKVPRFVEFREELPKTNVGKTLRRSLREEQNQTQSS
ncbi:long-chain-fatty-acid--CoA ligase [Salicibibacter kimchii]|uniref:Long-chain-fatty-acid--CoA ligase n=1 Tax=Salicibibacter kimchii TaxID=2099786 RepID=A0A345BWN6_9BACI|nr:long-chain fatty acid--CoA ligase [Salicibibacter kimchii]AXF55367.1 long-chain fatty acid--CoA ligase [Salicibibacter kimchii]